MSPPSQEVIEKIREHVRNPDNVAQIAEGKTKKIFDISQTFIQSGDDNGTCKSLVMIESKDQLTAFNAVRKNNLDGKAKIANMTTTNIFQYMQELGVPSHYKFPLSDTSFAASRCEMIPIEWVVRRVATGSFLKRNPGIKEGYRFEQLKVETFFKDDANDDPQWSDEQVINAEFNREGLIIGKAEIDYMKRLSVIIFQVLEKAWSREGCALIDLKVEYGVDCNKRILLADVIDNDSWRVWPKGDRRLQLDKQFYRDLKEVTTEALQTLIKNYEEVMNYTAKFTHADVPQCAIVMGSSADLDYCKIIAAGCTKYGIKPILRISSAHKSTPEALALITEFEASMVSTVFVAVAGRSNGLGLVIAGNSTLPVINCPPLNADWAAQDVWSSLRTPSGLGCTTVLGAEEAALAAAKILSLSNHMVFGRILADQLKNASNIYLADAALKATHL